MRTGIELIQDYLVQKAESTRYDTIKNMLLKLARLVALAVAFAIPLQGMAAAITGVCMAFDHHEGPAHAHIVASAGSPHGGDHQQGGPADQAPAADSAHCPPCVSCCAVAAISATSLAVPAHMKSVAAISMPHSSPPGTLPVQLERPPLRL